MMLLWFRFQCAWYIERLKQVILHLGVPSVSPTAPDFAKPLLDAQEPVTCSTIDNNSKY